jgi:hypothetical protein
MSAVYLNGRLLYHLQPYVWTILPYLQTYSSLSHIDQLAITSRVRNGVTLHRKIETPTEQR